MSVQRSSLSKLGIAFVVAFTVGFLVTCGPPPKRPIDDLCADVTCADGQHCDSADGACKEGEAPADAGSGDAGSTTRMDGGQDAGSHCSPACSGVTSVCDPGSQSCKVCIVEDTAARDPGCTETEPRCYPTANNGLGGCYQCRDDFDCEVDEYCNTTAGFCEAMEPTDGGSDVDGGTEVDGGELIDGGEVIDGGAEVDGGEVIDGGEGFDGGEVTDGGELDGGGADAGDPDAGVVDAGFMEPYPDDCNTRALRTIPMGAGQQLTIDADNAAGLDDFGGAPHGGPFSVSDCSRSGASADVVYELVLSSAGTLTITTVPDAASGSDPLVYLLEGTCESGSQVPQACGDTFNGYSFTTGTLQAGSYFLVVDSWGSASGPSTVTVTKN